MKRSRNRTNGLSSLEPQEVDSGRIEGSRMTGGAASTNPGRSPAQEAFQKVIRKLADQLLDLSAFKLGVLIIFEAPLRYSIMVDCPPTCNRGRRFNRPFERDLRSKSTGHASRHPRSLGSVPRNSGRIHLRPIRSLRTQPHLQS